MTSRSERFDAWKARPGRATLVALLEASQERVQALCWSVLRHQHDAEEAAQETLLEFILGIDGVKDAEHFERWLTTVATRTALDRRKSKRRRKVFELNGIESRHRESPYEGLHDAIDKLDEEDRNLLVERYFERRTLRVMGEQRRVSDVAVRKRIAKAQNRLKRLLGVFIIWGAGVVKAKAAVAALLLAALLVGVTWLAASRRAQESVLPMTGTKLHQRADASTETAALSALPTSTVSAVEDASAETVNAEREAFLQNLKRYKELDDRLRWCSQVPEGSGDHSVEINRLEQKDMPAIFKLLGPAALRFPTDTLAFFLSLEWGSAKVSIGWLLGAIVDSEKMEEGGRPGPILKELLSLAQGSAKDRWFLARLAEDLKQESLEVAAICFGFLDDADADVRYSALGAFARQAARGKLGDFFAKHKPQFQALALTGSESRPASFAFLALSAIGDKETDEFILQQFEVTASQPEAWSRAAAMARIGSRILPAQEQRVVGALRQVLDTPYHDSTYTYWIQLALQLTPPVALDILRYAGQRAPPSQKVLVEGLEGLARCVEAGKAEAALLELDRLKREGHVSEGAITLAARNIAATLK